MKKMKIGIIGCGVISHTYIRDIKRLYSNIEIAAVANSHVEKAQAVAKQYDIPKACSVEEILADEEIEMLVNLTPPAAHTEVNLQILNAGKHLFAEKPFALNMEDAKMVADLAMHVLEIIIGTMKSAEDGVPYQLTTSYDK